MITRDKYGLIGYPLAHSFSPAYFKNKFEHNNIKADYQLFPLKSILNFSGFINQNPDLKGLNVTIPYKEEVIAFLDELSPEAAEINAVNTIVFKGNRLIGYNTDAPAFEQVLTSNRIKPPFKALVFGTGGASKAVAYTLRKLEIEYILVSRLPKTDCITYNQLTELATSHSLWINTTPVGQFPNTDQTLPLPFSALSSKHVLIDLIYNPKETQFLKVGRLKGAKTINGLVMLHSQAEKAWKLWCA